MFSNLRSIPIEGHITDSAGNVLRNVQVIIKQHTPRGSIVVDTVSSDDSGYFITNPMPNGTYDIYESGIKLAKIIHDNGNSNFQCYQANLDNYNQSTIGNFLELAGKYELNSYKAFLQLEPQNLNVAQFGNSFPIYDRDIHDNPEADIGSHTNELYNIAKFFSLTDNSRITISRFDVEYFLPLVSTSNIYKRIKWAGVPGIRFYKDSKLVIPLDYYSIVANNAKYISPYSGSYPPEEISVDIDNENNSISLTDTVTDGRFTELAKKLFVGDILKLKFKDPESLEVVYWYGIVAKVAYSSTSTVYLERWRSSRFYTTSQESLVGKKVEKIQTFDGMFSNIMEIGQDANLNQLFTVTENFYAQNQENELYNYTDQISV